MMHKEPNTDASLILRLQNPDDADAWSEFVEIYEPLIYGLIRSKGFQHADAAELTQEVLLAIVRSVGRWDPDPKRGSFRGWLATITRNLMINFLSGPASRFVGTGRSSVLELLRQFPEGRPEESHAFDIELRRRLFIWAADIVRQQVQPTSWQAFWNTAVQRQPVNDVAAELGMSPGAVYIARSRVLHRLRKEVERHSTGEAVPGGTNDD